jgi:hypothetical protein
MAFIRRKRSAGGFVFQVVRSRRDAGKVKQDVLLSIGHHETLTSAIREVENIQRYYEQQGRQISPIWEARRQRLVAMRSETGLT